MSGTTAPCLSQACEMALQSSPSTEGTMFVAGCGRQSQSRRLTLTPARRTALVNSQSAPAFDEFDGVWCWPVCLCAARSHRIHH